MRTLIQSLLGMALLCGAVSQQAIAQADMEGGKALFNRIAIPACATCHTLAHAGAQGEIGPNMDELKPDASRVEKAVRNGIGQMPAFQGLADEQVVALAKYVAQVAGGNKPR